MRRAVHAYDGIGYPSGRGWSAVKLGKARIDSVLNEMGAILADKDFFAQPKLGINCQSGFIAFDKKGEPTLGSHTPDHRCRHVLPGSWTTQPRNAEAPPPKSLLGKLLNGIFLGDDDQNDKRMCLAEIAGAAAAACATRLLQPKAAVFKGESAENGKSQVLDLYRGVLPPAATAAISASKFADDRFIVGLVGKHLNAVDELSTSMAITSEIFKQVVTGEPVSGRDVYRSAVQFRAIAQQVFSVNLLPTFAGGMDRGVQRRLLVITFNRLIPITERIEDIGKRIAEEEPDQLLAWTVAGARRLIKNRRFTVAKSSQEALELWCRGADPVLAWAADRVDPPDKFEMEDPKRLPKVKSGQAHQKFHDWAVAAGYHLHQIPAVNGFVQRLLANKYVPGITVQHKRSGNWLVGLKILNNDRPDVDEDLSN